MIAAAISKKKCMKKMTKLIYKKHTDAHVIHTDLGKCIAFANYDYFVSEFLKSINVCMLKYILHKVRHFLVCKHCELIQHKKWLKQDTKLLQKTHVCQCVAHVG